MFRIKIDEPQIKMSDIISLVIVLLALAVYLGGDSMGTVELGASFVIFLFGFKKWEMKKAIPVFVLTGAVLILLVTSGRMGATGFNAPIKHAIKFVHLLFAFVCYLYLKNMADERWKRIFVIAVLAAAAVSCLRSIYMVFTGNDYAIRYASKYGYNDAGVAGFSQIYGIPFLIVAVFFLLCYIGNSRKFVSFCLLVLLAIFLYFIFRSLMVTALILSAFGIVLLLYLKIIRRSPAAALMILLIIVAAAALILFVFPEQMMGLLKKFTASLNYVTRNRILYIAEQVLQTPSGVSYSYDRRNEIASYSINTFRTYPLFGVGYSGFKYGVIGCHQEWYDLLGTFGLVGSVIVWGVIGWIAFTVFKGLERRAEKELFCTMLVMFVILGFLNPCLGAPLLMAMFTVTPNLRYFARPALRQEILAGKRRKLIRVAL